MHGKCDLIIINQNVITQSSETFLWCRMSGFSIHLVSLNPIPFLYCNLAVESGFVQSTINTIEPSFAVHFFIDNPFLSDVHHNTEEIILRCFRYVTT